MRIFPTILLLMLIPATNCCAQWTGFRGPDGQGISTDTKIPIEWSESESKNLRWKVKLPGPGSSSPVLTDQRVFVTCYTGYGDGDGDSQDRLQRHLLCLARSTGEVDWVKDVPAALPEDPYQGYIAEHGYASSTPVTDGERVYVFLGKSGVFAYGLDGTQLWQVDVGHESSNRRWGSAASLVLYKDTVIVNASEESRSILALDQRTGKQRWKAEAASLELCFSTPALVELPGEHAELVVGVPGEIWGLNPDTGKLRWYAPTTLTGNICPSPVFKDGTVFVFGGFRSFGSVAVRAGGKGDVSDSHVKWAGRSSSYVATPLLHEGRLYWVDDRGLAHCLDADNGEEVYRSRMPDLQGGGRPFYASPVLANGHLYIVSRRSGCFVLPARPQFQVVAHNHLDDDSDFNGTPAIDGGQMFLRSNQYLYCIAEE